MIVLAYLLLMFSGCHDSTGPTQSNVYLKANMGVTDGSLLLKHIPFPADDQFEIKENGIVVVAGRLPRTDTIFYVTGLKPDQSYSFESVVLENNRETFTSGILNTATLDTTDNEYRWEFDTLGGASSSEFRAVTILNDTCAYAVGDAFAYDSTGAIDVEPYNLARWDGKKWLLTKVGTYYNGRLLTDELTSIYALSANDIWIGGGGGEAYHWDGNSWTDKGTVNTVFVGRSRGMFGTDDANMYMVGTNGAMAHYDGSRWQTTPTNTTLDIEDIWGATDPLSAKLTILAVAGNYYVGSERKILRISGLQASALSDSGIHWALNSIWFTPGKEYLVVGAGVYEKGPDLDQPLWNSYSFTNYGTSSVRGTDVNNIFIAGAYGDLWHFNGVRWTSLDAQTQTSGAYQAIAARSKMVIAVGYLGGSQAIIAVGRRK